MPEDQGYDEDQINLSQLPGQPEPDDEELRQMELERMQNEDGPR